MHRVLGILALGLLATDAAAVERRTFEAYCTYVGQTYAYAATLRDLGKTQDEVAALLPPVPTPFTHGTTAAMHEDILRRIFKWRNVAPAELGAIWRDACLERESAP